MEVVVSTNSGITFRSKENRPENYCVNLFKVYTIS